MFVTTKQIQRLDKIAIQDYGIPSLALMENAGRLTAEEIKKYLRRKKSSFVCVVCGMGNNAGDGFVVSRHLSCAGIASVVYCAGNPKDLKNDAAVNYRILKKAGHPVKQIMRSVKDFDKDLQKADCVIDAVFGVGLTRDVGGFYKKIIERINQYSRYTISVDVPSGLDASTGIIKGVCVKARKTVTFTFAKKGLACKDGPGQCGKVVVADIGIPDAVKKKALRNK